MAGAHITVDDQEVRAALANLLTQVKRPERALRDIGEALLRSTDERFRREVGPDGQPWAQNSDVTLLRYLESRQGLSKRTLKSGGRNLTQRGAKLLGAKKVLRQSGALQNTIRYQLTSDGQGLELGTNRVYGAMQQFGGTKAQWPHLWGNIPARPFLGLSADDKQDILAIFSRHLSRP